MEFGFLQTYGKEITALIVPFITLVLNSFFKAKARLEVSQPHLFTFLVQEPLLDANGNEIQPNQTASTRSVLIRNSGRETATKVEIVFNWKPMCANVWPPRRYTENVQNDNRYTLTFDSLSPGESLGCEILAVNNQLPEVVTVRCDQCIGQWVDMYPQPATTKRQRIIGMTLMFFGLATVVYLLIMLLQFLVLKTPYGH